jgi:heptose III glucuronosyltransferase
MHRETPIVSVVVPAYNAAPYLGACLDSLLAQTQPDLEIIVVDDGSTDETPAILSAYASRCSHLRVVTQDNRGVSVARNVGLAVARGDFVAYVDSDDVVVPTMYAELIRRALADSLDVTVCNAWRHGYDDSRQMVYPTDMRGDVAGGPTWMVRAVAARSLRHYIVCHLYRRDFLTRSGIRFVPRLTHQDIVWTNEVLLAAKRMAFLNRPLYHYLQRRGSLSKPETSAGRLDAARHYMRVAKLLDRLAVRHESNGSAVHNALRHQVIEEGVAVFHLARHLSAPHRRALYSDLRESGFVALLWRNACHAAHRRRILKRSLRFQFASAGHWLRALVSGTAADEMATADMPSEFG